MKLHLIKKVSFLLIFNINVYLYLFYIMDIPIYVINFNDDVRKQAMINRFKSIGLNLVFTKPVYTSDSRLNVDVKFDKRTWAIMLQHLDGIRDFYENTTCDYCIVCEDDIMISKNLKNDLPLIIDNFNKLNLDVLLLGYLMPSKIHNNYYKMIKQLGYSFHEFPDDLWGSQMYLVSRNHAKFLLEKYTVEWASQNLDKPYSPDWILTKVGKRAFIYPMVALEGGDTKTDNVGQNDFHRTCFITNYDPDIYI